MLISFLLTLTPEAPATLPADLGRAVQAETLARLARVAPDLAEQVHAGDGPKPLTCSNLMVAEPASGRRANHPADSLAVRPESPCLVRITGLTGPVCRALRTALVEGAPSTWTLHEQTFRVTGVICDPAQDAWTGQASYEGLTAAVLQRGDRQPRSVTLEFVSPTAFKSQEMQVPLPLPGLVFGSLVERWNAFSPVALDPDLRRFAAERVAISRYRLESRPVATKNGALRIGGVGRVTYAILDADRYALAGLNILADFAFYSGVGVQTATGMGQCRRV